MPHNEVRVVGIPGSLRARSYTRMALAEALRGAEAAGAKVELLDLRSYALVFVTGEDGEDEAHPDVRRLSAAVAAADGIVLGTPEYHGGYSGVLKNALDLMGFDEFGGKMVGLVGVSGGAMGGHNALQGLRTVGRSLHAWVVPTEASVPHAWKAFETDGTIKDERLAKRLRAVGREVATYAALHTSADAERFLKLWEEAVENPGGA